VRVELSTQAKRFKIHHGKEKEGKEGREEAPLVLRRRSLLRRGRFHLGAGIGFLAVYARSFSTENNRKKRRFEVGFSNGDLEQAF
jgi:hypothetical protein